VPDDLTPAGAPRGVNAEAPELDAFKAVVTEEAPSRTHAPQLTTATVFATATAKASAPINPAQSAPTAAVDFEAPNTGSGSAQLEHGPVKQAALPSIIAK